VPWQVLHAYPRDETWNECAPVPGGIAWQEPHAGAGGTYVQVCDRTGVPPVQPAGDAVSCVLVWVLLDWQAPQAEYVNEVQAAGVGGTYVQDCVRTGIPTQPAGDDVATVLVWVLLDWHAPQALYV